MLGSSTKVGLFLSIFASMKKNQLKQEILAQRDRLFDLWLENDRMLNDGTLQHSITRLKLRQEQCLLSEELQEIDYFFLPTKTIETRV